MPRPRKLLLVPCPTHGADPCPNNNGCPERRKLAGLPPLKGTTGAERNRRAGPMRDFERGLALVENSIGGLTSEQRAAVVPRIRLIAETISGPAASETQVSSETGGAHLYTPEVAPT